MQNDNPPNETPSKVETTLSEIKQKLVEAQALVVDIGDIKNEIKRHKNNVVTSTQNVTTATEANTKIAQLVASVDAYVQKFETTKESVEDEDEGVLAVFQQIKEYKSTSDSLLLEITKSREEVDVLKSSASEDVQQISKILQQRYECRPASLQNII